MDAKLTKISTFKESGIFLHEACGSQKGLLFFRTFKVGQFAKTLLGFCSNIQVFWEQLHLTCYDKEITVVEGEFSIVSL